MPGSALSLSNVAGAALRAALNLALGVLQSKRDSANLSLTFSVGSSALTIAAKQQGGSDATSTSPIVVGQRSATATSGDANTRTITAALSLVVSSGSTLGQRASDPRWTHAYLIDNAGTQELAVSSKFFGLQGIVSTTAEGGAGGADSESVMYSTSARSNVSFLWLGRFKAPQTVAGTWAAVPTSVETGILSPSADTSGSLVLLDTKTAAAVATLDLTSNIDSTFDEYLLVITDAVPATDDASPWLRVSEDAGATFKAGASDYKWSAQTITSAGTVAAAGSTGDTKMLLTQGAISSTASKGGWSGEIRFHNPAGTTANKRFHWRGSGQRSSSANFYDDTGSGLFVLDTNAINGVRFMFSTGNITSGNFALYGLKKS